MQVSRVLLSLIITHSLRLVISERAVGELCCVSTVGSCVDIGSLAQQNGNSTERRRESYRELEEI
jgi:hypothetical protein